MPVVVSCTVIFPAHTSSAVLVCLASWVMMLIGRVRIRELMKLLGLRGRDPGRTLNLGRSETAEGRVETWIDLWTKSQTEKPIEQLTDTERSMIAIYNGGIFGEGAGQSAMRVEMIHPGERLRLCLLRRGVRLHPGGAAAVALPVMMAGSEMACPMALPAPTTWATS